MDCDSINNLVTIDKHSSVDFKIENAYGYSMRINKFCILYIVNNTGSTEKETITVTLPFKFKEQCFISVVDNDSNFETNVSSYSTKVGWINNNKFNYKNIYKSHTILLVGALE